MVIIGKRNSTFRDKRPDTDGNLSRTGGLCYVPGMPFLNWREIPVAQRIDSHPRREKLLHLEIPAASLAGLVDALEGVFARAEGELRVELPEGWALFWKEREGESRLLLAHPTEHAWVATAALTREDGLAVVTALRALAPASSVDVGELVPVARMSNMELRLRLGA
jgi:hypothetical protein